MQVDCASLAMVTSNPSSGIPRLTCQHCHLWRQFDDVACLSLAGDAYRGPNGA